jgi:hypothetical protein
MASEIRHTTLATGKQAKGGLRMRELYERSWPKYVVVMFCALSFTTDRTNLKAA